MRFIDIFRFVIFGEAGAVLAFMIGTNILAWKVLRPPRKLGFLWWHITTVSVGFVCIASVALERVAGRLGQPASWRTCVALVGFTALLAAQVIIYHVERQRYVARIASDKHGDDLLAEALRDLNEG